MWSPAEAVPRLCTKLKTPGDSELWYGHCPSDQRWSGQVLGRGYWRSDNPLTMRFAYGLIIGLLKLACSNSCLVNH